jgi:tight adherence protein C
MILVVIVSGIIAAMIGPEHPSLVLGTVAAGLVIVALAWAVPRVYLAFKGHWRIQRIRATLPDALDMMTMCMTGGLPMQEALVHVSRELYFAHPELALEFLIVKQHADMSSLETAFARFADRVDGPEIVALASLITQNQRLGANVAAAIYDFSDSLRLQRRQSADELAGRASVKILLPIALCLLPSVLMVMWGPGVIELMQFFRSFDSPDSLNF